MIEEDGFMVWPTLWARTAKGKASLQSVGRTCCSWSIPLTPNAHSVCEVCHSTRQLLISGFYRPPLPPPDMIGGHRTDRLTSFISSAGLWSVVADRSRTAYKILLLCFLATVITTCWSLESVRLSLPSIMHIIINCKKICVPLAQYRHIVRPSTWPLIFFCGEK